MIIHQVNRLSTLATEQLCELTEAAQHTTSSAIGTPVLELCQREWDIAFYH